MSVWNKVLLGLIAVAGLVFFHAALRTVKTFSYWSKKTYDFEQKLGKVRAEIHNLQTADHEHPLEDKSVGVPQLRADLSRLLATRGRIWTNCAKKNAQVQPKNGRLEVTVTSDEGGFSDKMLLYVFEEGDDQSPGRYLGEYSVSAVSDKDVVLVSTTQPPLMQTKNVQDSKNTTTWALYEMMPTDQHALFASLPDDKKKFWYLDEPKKFFGEDYAADFQTDANANNGDSGETKAGQAPKAERPLRDYLEYFRVCEVERTLFEDKKNALERDQLYLTNAKEDSEKQQAFAEKEKVQAQQEFDWELKQKQAAAEHYANLQVMLNFNDEAVKAAIQANAGTAREIARLQKEAADQIDRRTRSMVPYGAGAN